MNTVFCDLLLKWNKTSNDRPMPWKGEKEPYKIWLSEIILQQTRVEQGRAYYENFVKKYPTVQLLAQAKEKEVYKMWEGLGYYNRCKNLLFTAKYIAANLKGIFPNKYDALLELKGVGPYTAAAIASFAYNLPYAVVDGNVFRVFARYYGIHTPIDTKEGLEIFNKIAQANLAKKKAGIYNQALMDFGATICKPASPLCSSCLMKTTCVAFNENLVGQLPAKLKVIQKKKRYFDFCCFIVGDKWFIQKRAAGDIWAGLYQFYLIENEKAILSDRKYFTQILKDQLMIEDKSVDILPNENVFHQQLTHQLLEIRFSKIYVKEIPRALEKGLWVKMNALLKYPFPKTIIDFLAKEG